ncbi:hypothetical protein ACHAXT_000905 [Thalassiosira profunda]
MALTGYEDEDTLSDGELVDMPESTSEEEHEDADSAPTEENEVELRGLTESNLEEHNKSTEGEEVQVQACQNETGTEVPSQVGAGLLFGLSGLVLGGPILGVFTGVGAALVATNNDGPVGDAARASGDFAVSTGSRVGDAARDANEKHHILEKIGNLFKAGWSRVRQFDEEHHASEKVKETMSDVTQRTVEFERKHHYVENLLEGIRSGVSHLLDKLREDTCTPEEETGAATSNKIEG